MGDGTGASIRYPATTVHREVWEIVDTPVKPTDFDALTETAFPHKTGGLLGRNKVWEEIKKEIKQSCEKGACTPFPGCHSKATPFCPERPFNYTPPLRDGMYPGSAAAEISYTEPPMRAKEKTVGPDGRIPHTLHSTTL